MHPPNRLRIRLPSMGTAERRRPRLAASIPVSVRVEGCSAVRLDGVVMHDDRRIQFTERHIAFERRIRPEQRR